MSAAHAARRGSGRPAKAALAVGFLALAAGVLVARRSPATGYELSIYGATPPGFWAGAAVATVVALAVAWHPAVRGRLRALALLLGGLAVFAVAALPLLRGYYYVGAGDALTHLGWTADLAAGRLEPVAFLYPALHTVSLVVARVTDVGLARAIEYVVLCFALVFLLFVPLAVRAVAGTDRALVVGAFAGMLFLPVNNVSVHLMAHPTTQAILFVPAVVYLLVRYLARPAGRGALPVGTPFGVLLAVSSVALVLLHPQTALNAVLLFVAVLAVQALARRTGSAAADHRPPYAQTALLVLAFGLWAPRNDRVRGTVSGVVENLLGGAPVADEIARRGASLSALGGGLPELFVKLFGPSAVFAAAAGLLALAAAAGRLDGDPERAALVRYLAAGAVPVFGAFLVFFGLSVSTQAFRYTGFLMVLATVLGAVAVSMAVGGLARRTSVPAARTVAAVGFVLLLPLATLTLFGSPFVYQPSPGVSEATMTGYGAAFAHRAPAVLFAGVHGGPVRFVHAVYGTEPVVAGDRGVPGQTARVPAAVLASNLTGYYDVGRYVPVTDRQVAREVTLYRGLRYPARGFRALETTPGVNRVRANGEFRLYLVDADAG